MYHKLFNALVIIVLLSTLLVAAPVSARVPAPDDVTAAGGANSVPTVARKAPIAIGAIASSTKRQVTPRTENVERILRAQGSLPLNASAEQVQAAVEAYYKQFFKRNADWISPKAQASALQREAALSEGTVQDLAIQPITATAFALAVDFGATETFTLPVPEGSDCVTQTVTIAGPRQGELEHPGPRDNNTIWYSPTQTADVKFYNDLVFGYQGIGRVRYDLTDPVDGRPGINLNGYTVQDYYDHVAGRGNVNVTGTIEGWVTVPHSEGHYGAPNCGIDSDGGAGVPVGQLVVDAVNVFSQTHPSYYNDTSANAFWKQYDANHDGVVDTFWIIHAGMGEEAGGGAEGMFSIWSHSWDLRAFAAYAANGYKVYEGDPTTTADDIYIQPYTMQPENCDLGVLVEEFGHNFFALPDLYTTDAQNSVGFWSEMSAGSWGGYIGGGTPVGMPLWFRMIAWCGQDAQGNPIYCNWQEPMVTRSYDDLQANITIGQLEGTPAGVNKGVRVNLPPILEEIPNNAGTGKCAYTGTGINSLDATLMTMLTIPAVGTGLVTASCYWDIESDYDYGYVMLKEGSNPADPTKPWVYLHDLDGYMTDSNPNGANLGWGLTGTSDEAKTLRFDFAPYKGKTVIVALRYRTDTGVTRPGWWVDDIKLDGVTMDDFEGATPPSTFDKWSNSDPGWQVAPTSRRLPSYYLVEWRSDTKYDKMVRTAYQTALNEGNEWKVARIPYNIPGALVYYRNGQGSGGYTLLDGSEYNPPSIGPKHQLLVVDMNYGAVRLSATGPYSNTLLNARVGSYDAPLSLQATQPFTLTEVYTARGVVTGTFTFPSKPAVAAFNDTKGYYAGLYLGAPCDPGYVCFGNIAGSVVVPARGIYSTRITDFAGAPLYRYYGATVADLPLGNGNPGDDGVQYGTDIRLLSKTADNSRATLRFSNFSADMATTAPASVALALPGTYTVTYQTVVENVGMEPLENLALTYTLDTQLSLASMAVTGTVPSDVSFQNRSWSAEFMVPGDVVTLTVVATGTTDVPLRLNTRVDGFDGLNVRGPWFLKTKVLGQLFLPLALKAR